MKRITLIALLFATFSIVGCEMDTNMESSGAEISTKGNGKVVAEGNGVYRAEWTSSHKDERCTEMTPHLKNLATQHCGGVSNVEGIGRVWCNEAPACPGNLCTHYGYYRFRCK